MTDHITLMAAGELREALAALRRGDRGAAVAGLMAIDPQSWHAIEKRLSSLGGSLPELLTLVRSNHER
ncbi:hypothetical protein [Streptomyces sp. JJ36]|uniref:hypothetical protein n=1 Tax=Streptomyces sp. JJ36 TaxID=2736645 RepID=UPI001F1BEC49|nr:hypothetical protein [Streptomyces sp. JJ36]MCF6525668.1 hypothetical protein [Streptomyces sp. JJ36]